mmetsp:Transcript_11949/g.27930  ORF Transcript_11949/g.27930 Transcript_11949/m.27930 type:complete len:595 (+) Transcript_11949:86-1870(+)
MGKDLSGALLALPEIFEGLGKVMEVKSVLGAALEAIAEQSQAIEAQQGALLQMSDKLDKHSQIHEDLAARMGSHEDKFQALEAAAAAAAATQAEGKEALSTKLAEAEEGHAARLATLESKIDTQLKEAMEALRAQVTDLKAEHDKVAEMQGSFVLAENFSKELDEMHSQLAAVEETVPPLAQRLSTLEQEQIDNNVVQRLSLMEDELLLNVKVEIAALKDELAAIPAVPMGYGGSVASSPPPSAPAGDVTKPLTPPVTPPTPAPAAAASQGPAASAAPSAEASQSSARPVVATPPTPQRQGSPHSPGRPSPTAAASASGSEKAKSSRMAQGQKPREGRKAKEAGGASPSVASVLLMEGDTRWVGKEEFSKTSTAVEQRMTDVLTKLDEMEKRLESKVKASEDRLDGRFDALSQRQEALGQQLQARQDAKFVTVMDHMMQQLNGLKSVVDESSEALKVDMEAISEARKDEALQLQEGQSLLANEIKRIETQFSACTTNCLACGASPRPIQPERALVGVDGAQYGGNSPSAGRNEIGAPVQQFLSREWEWETARTPLRKGGGFTTSTAHFYDGTAHSRSAQSLGLQIVQDGRKSRA